MGALTAKHTKKNTLKEHVNHFYRVRYVLMTRVDCITFGRNAGGEHPKTVEEAEIGVVGDGTHFAIVENPVGARGGARWRAHVRSGSEVAIANERRERTETLRGGGEEEGEG